MEPIHVIGGGLAGTEAAWQIAESGHAVVLHEMRPERTSPAHHTEHLAELVCSNSFGAKAVDRAAGLLHEELRRLGSLVIRIADAHAVPAGGALAVDRAVFSAELTRAIESHPNATLVREEVPRLPTDGIAVVTTGPLTTDALADDLQRFCGQDYMSFFDAASPIIEGESIDRDIVFRASRYDKGEAAYLNCPMSKDEYLAFRDALCSAEQAPLEDFERESAKFFEACLPIEEMAQRGEDTMRFGPMKPVGLYYPDRQDDRGRPLRPYAVVQLRQEDKAGRLWNMVGFQTNLRWGEQTRVFRMIPGLAKAEFVRMGVMHRNTFLNAPELLRPTLQFRARDTLLAAGQLVGTEGYTAAVAGGWLAGTNASRLKRALQPIIAPPTTMLGALIDFIASASPDHYQPMPPNFGIIPELPTRVRNKRDRYRAYAERSLRDLTGWYEDSCGTRPAPA